MESVGYADKHYDNNIRNSVHCRQIKKKHFLKIRVLSWCCTLVSVELLSMKSNTHNCSRHVVPCIRRTCKVVSTQGKGRRGADGFCTVYSCPQATHSTCTVILSPPLRFAISCLGAPAYTLRQTPCIALTAVEWYFICPVIGGCSSPVTEIIQCFPLVPQAEVPDRDCLFSILSTRNSSVSIVTRLRAGQPGFDSRQG
jgi:hypothetical protein